MIYDIHALIPTSNLFVEKYILEHTKWLYSKTNFNWNRQTTSTYM